MRNIFICNDPYILTEEQYLRFKKEALTGDILYLEIKNKIYKTLITHVKGVEIIEEGYIKIGSITFDLMEEVI